MLLFRSNETSEPRVNTVWDQTKPIPDNTNNKQKQLIQCNYVLVVRLFAAAIRWSRNDIGLMDTTFFRPRWGRIKNLAALAYVCAYGEEFEMIALSLSHLTYHDSVHSLYIPQSTLRTIHVLAVVGECSLWMFFCAGYTSSEAFHEGTYHHR